MFLKSVLVNGNNLTKNLTEFWDPLKKSLMRKKNENGFGLGKMVRKGSKKKRYLITNS